MNVAKGCLLVAFTESPNDQAALEFQRKVLVDSIRRETQGIILDVSGVSLMDSVMSKSLVDTCQAVQILGKMTVVIGLKPAVVASLVDLEIDLSRINVAVNIEEAMPLINPPIVDAGPLEAKDAAPDEDAEREEEDEDEVRETEEDLPE